MVLSSTKPTKKGTRQQQQPQQSQHQDGNKNSGQLYETISPFEELTGYKFYSTPTITAKTTTSSCAGIQQSSSSAATASAAAASVHRRRQQQQPQPQQQRRSHQQGIDQLAKLKAKNLFLMEEEECRDEVHNDNSGGCGTEGHNKNVPSEIYISNCDGRDDLPYMITVDGRDVEDVSSEVSIEDSAFFNNSSTRSGVNSGINQNNSFLLSQTSATQICATNTTTTTTTSREEGNHHQNFPPLCIYNPDLSYLHAASPFFTTLTTANAAAKRTPDNKKAPKIVYHDPTWGTTVAALDDAVWPSDEEDDEDDEGEVRDEAPVPPPPKKERGTTTSKMKANMSMCTEAFLPCAGLRFWTKGQVHEHNLTRDNDDDDDDDDDGCSHHNNSNLEAAARSSSRHNNCCGREEQNQCFIAECCTAASLSITTTTRGGGRRGYHKRHQPMMVNCSVSRRDGSPATVDWMCNHRDGSSYVSFPIAKSVHSTGQ